MYHNLHQSPSEKQIPLACYSSTLYPKEDQNPIQTFRADFQRSETAVNAQNPQSTYRELDPVPRGAFKSDSAFRECPRQPDGNTRIGGLWNARSIEHQRINAALMKIVDRIHELSREREARGTEGKSSFSRREISMEFIIPRERGTLNGRRKASGSKGISLLGRYRTQESAIS